MSMTLASEVKAARGGSKSSASLSCHIVLKPQAGHLYSSVSTVKPACATTAGLF